LSSYTILCINNHLVFIEPSAMEVNFLKMQNYFSLHFVITTVRKEMQQRLKLFCGFCWKTNRSE
jgi:hypothetical protein